MSPLVFLCSLVVFRVFSSFRPVQYMWLYSSVIMARRRQVTESHNGGSRDDSLSCPAGSVGSHDSSAE